MKAESVRDLKQELKAELLHGETALPREFHRFGATKALAAKASQLHTRRPRSVGMALGIAKGTMSGDYRLSVRIQVRGKPGNELAARVVQRTKGECDIRFLRDVRAKQSAAWYRKRRRPLEAGLSVSLAGPVETAGTLGCIVEDAKQHYILSNNHVLANINNAEAGDPVVQPGTLDRAPTSASLIGVLERFIPISFKRSNLVDAAVAALFPDIEFYAAWTEALPGVVQGTKKLTVSDLGRPVFKAGRTTGVTEGHISSVDVDRLAVDMADPGTPPKLAEFSDQIEVQGSNGRGFSGAGDSGSLIVDRRGRAVALLFSGGTDRETGQPITFANRIENVLRELAVKITP
ncbi:MAG: hypothetical protein HKP27_09790 [Myxococcales bacterium]|nr:hypothetical protein [Myxococcales bacterium]